MASRTAASVRISCPISSPLTSDTALSRAANQRATELLPEPIPPTIPITGICVRSDTNETAVGGERKPSDQQSVAILVCRRAFRSHTDERNAVRKALAPSIVPDRVTSVNDKRIKIGDSNA